MRILLRSVGLLLFFLFIGACVAAEPVEKSEPPTPMSPSLTVAVQRSCAPTLDDGVSPSYKADAPERTVVGSGHVITGVVLSSVDCQPIANAKLEFWPEEEGLGHPDSSRATFFTDENGRYRFESNMPEHIHMKISAEGFRTIGVNSYHPEGKAEGILDIVLTPE